MAARQLRRFKRSACRDPTNHGEAVFQWKNYETIEDLVLLGWVGILCFDEKSKTMKICIPFDIISSFLEKRLRQEPSTYSSTASFFFV